MGLFRPFRASICVVDGFPKGVALGCYVVGPLGRLLQYNINTGQRVLPRTAHVIGKLLGGCFGLINSMWHSAKDRGAWRDH